MELSSDSITHLANITFNILSTILWFLLYRMTKKQSNYWYGKYIKERDHLTAEVTGHRETRMLLMQALMRESRRKAAETGKDQDD